MNHRVNVSECLRSCFCGLQVELQQKELLLLDRKLEQWKQEEEVLRVSVEKHRQGLLDVLRQGEEDVHSLHQRIQVCIIKTNIKEACHY